jgi:hypothetical protein
MRVAGAGADEGKGIPDDGGMVAVLRGGRGTGSGGGVGLGLGLARSIEGRGTSNEGRRTSVGC